MKSQEYRILVGFGGKRNEISASIRELQHAAIGWIDEVVHGTDELEMKVGLEAQSFGAGECGVL